MTCIQRCTALCDNYVHTVSRQLVYVVLHLVLQALHLFAIHNAPIVVQWRNQYHSGGRQAVQQQVPVAPHGSCILCHDYKIATSCDVMGMSKLYINSSLLIISHNHCIHNHHPSIIYVIIISSSHNLPYPHSTPCYYKIFPPLRHITLHHSYITVHHSYITLHHSYVMPLPPSHSQSHFITHNLSWPPQHQVWLHPQLSGSHGCCPSMVRLDAAASDDTVTTTMQSISQKELQFANLQWK